MAKGIGVILRNVENGDDSIDHKRINAKFWVKAHGFSNVRRFLFATLLELLESDASSRGSAASELVEKRWNECPGARPALHARI